MDVFNRSGSRIGSRYLIASCAAFAACASLPAIAEVYTNDDGQRVECHYEQTQSSDGHPVAAPVIGAIAGGVVGHQFGGGKGNDLATVAGAGAGAYAGKKYNDSKTDDQGSTRKVCQPVS
ncbi:MAG: hypothetical protein JWQ90_3223 [Hydrocarboniphaga sp.]|nr:glycine zipper 2TM domain-containing protein [Hydrocarboniphaga sp.]MDB5970773.1 hypothetical protein [Hydrocarboniphaga sp.]